MSDTPRNKVFNLSLNAEQTRMLEAVVTVHIRSKVEKFARLDDMPYWERSATVNDHRVMVELLAKLEAL